MTTPTEAPVEVLDETDGELRIRLPVVVIEGLDTSDGRFITPGALTPRGLPLSLLAQTESAHGGDDPGPAVVVGRIDRLERRPGPEVVSRRTGQPFPDGTFVWVGEGTIGTDVAIGGRNVADMVRRRFLRGVSVDLVGMDFEVLGEDGFDADAEHPNRQIITHGAELAAATLCAIPAFGDCYVELADEQAVPEPLSADEMPAGLVASAVPAWRSAEVGDYPPHPALTAAADGEEHTGGMVALVPANAAELTVDGGEPAEELHLTLAYLGDDVSGWPAARRDALIEAMRVHARRGPITARVMAHARFNPDGGADGDRDPCAVYLVGDSDQLAPLRSAVMTEVGEDEDLPAQHEPVIFHITAGYGLASDALSYVGPVTFDRLRVALAGDVVDLPLGGEPAAEDPTTEEEVVMAAATPGEPVEETGMPDAPQNCYAGDHPAVRSLLFDRAKRYAATCDEHDPDARQRIADEFGPLAGVVPILEEVPA